MKILMIINNILDKKIYTEIFSPIYTSEGKRCDNYQNKYFTIKISPKKS